jgi:hypothetical protein
MAQPFARAKAMFALIAAAMGNLEKLAAIGPYRSRGKGGRHSKPGNGYRRNHNPVCDHPEEQAALRRRLGGFKGDKVKQLEIYYGR